MNFQKATIWVMLLGMFSFAAGAKGAGCERMDSCTETTSPANNTLAGNQQRQSVSRNPIRRWRLLANSSGEGNEASAEQGLAIRL